MQERVISKLEALLEKGSRERGSSKGLAASSPSGPSVSHADVKAMESQLRAKDLRIMALESQLSVNAAAYAQELSALRMQAMLRAASARSEQVRGRTTHTQAHTHVHAHSFGLVRANTGWRKPLQYTMSFLGNRDDNWVPMCVGATVCLSHRPTPPPHGHVL
jgi:hypothetical protein